MEVSMQKLRCLLDVCIVIYLWAALCFMFQEILLVCQNETRTVRLGNLNSETCLVPEIDGFTGDSSGSGVYEARELYKQTLCP